MKKKLSIRLLTLLLALVMVLPGMPIFADETSAEPGDVQSSESDSAAPGETEFPSDSESDSNSESTEPGETEFPSDSESDSNSESTEPGEPGDETTKPEEDYKLPPFDEQTESIPDKFEFDEDMWYIAYKNTTTYSLVRSKNAMVLVKAYLLELYEKFFKMTAEDPDLAWKVLNGEIENLTAEQRESYESRMGAQLLLVEDAVKRTEREIIIAQYDWDTQTDLTGRADVGAMAKELITSASDFFIHVTENGDIWCVGGANTTTVVAFDFMIDRLMKVDREQRYVAIEKGLTYIYHHEERDDTPFVIKNMGENAFEFTLQANSMEKDMFCRLTYDGSNGWRLQDKQVYSEDYNNLGAAQLLSATVGETTQLYAEKLTYTENGDQLTITAPDGSYVVVNTTSGQFEFYTKSGKLVQKMLGATHTVYHGMHTVTARFAISKSDVIYGSGGQFNELNLNGKLLTLYSNDIFDSTSSVYTVIPFFMNTNGSAIFMNRNEYMTVDLGNTTAGEMVFTITNGSLDVYIFTTESMADAIKEYSEISGFADMPADWSYGMLVCRYDKEFSTLDGVYEMIAKMDEYGLAWSGVILEDWSPYAEGKHADLKKLCDYLHSLGKKVIVYVQTGNIPNAYENGAYLMNYTAPKAKGPASRVPSNSNGEYWDEKDYAAINASTPYYYIDLTNPEAVEWFFDTYWDKLLNEIGVDGAKIDLGGLIVDTVGTLHFYDANMSTAGTHHWYASSFNTLLWQSISSKPDGGICYANTAGIGAQRTPYMWAGDQSMKSNRLQRQLNYVLTAGLSGIPFVSYDMGTGSYPIEEGKVAALDIESEALIFLRSLEMSSFMPSMQTSGSMRRPYDYAEEDADFAYVTELYKLYTKLHESLIPYLEECSVTATETGMPVVRHLILNYPSDANVTATKDQYMLGDAFLVAPDLKVKENAKRDIYLPEGKWLDLNSGEIYEVPAGGQTLSSYKANIAQVPVFYNMNTTSATAAEVLPSVQAVMDLINEVDF